MKKELKIQEIMEKRNYSRNEAEKVFYKEICEKYGTDDVVLAESIFYVDF